GSSSAGRASRSQCEGREFDPPLLHHTDIKAACGRLLPIDGICLPSAMSSFLPSAALQLYRDCAIKARTYAELPFGKPGRTLKKSVYGEKFLYREVAVLSGDIRLHKLGPL